MKNYIIRRLLQLIPVLLGISIAIFAVLRLIPAALPPVCWALTQRPS